MTKCYEDYAAERKARLSPDGRTAVRMFNGAYAVGQMIASARTSRRYSQTRLSELSGVTQADISRIERGLLAPTAPTIMRLVEALDGELRIDLKEPSTV